MTPHIQTYRGISLNPLDPKPEDIDIEDIAHALSMICRFTGHCHRFYSVAEHSINVSRLLPSHLRLKGLLHDASEAYMADIARPIKHSDGFSKYRELEHHLQSAIDEKFCITGDDRLLKSADLMMLHVEAIMLFPTGSHISNWDSKELDRARKFINTFDFKLDCHYPMRAKQLFLNEYKFLTS